MTDRAPEPRDPREERLDRLREEAARTGRVTGTGVTASGGPVPPTSVAAGYYGRPILKPPVWTWEVPVYLFVGGTAGMSAVLAAAALWLGHSVLVARTASFVAAAGALISPVLLTLDLGRPSRFLAMLRVFKLRSAMSVGAWTLVAFCGAAVPAAALLAFFPELLLAGVPRGLAGGALDVALAAAALFGALLATYPGVLLGATAIPAWSSHRALLPLHFGLAGLGSAAALLELAGHRVEPLWALGLGVALVETGVGAWVELRRLGAVDRPLHSGRSGVLLRVAGVCAGPLAVALRLAGLVPWAAASFLVGALVSRWGWVEAGKASAADPVAVLEAGAPRPG